MDDSANNTAVNLPNPHRKRWYELTATEWAVVAITFLILMVLLHDIPAWYRHRHTCVVCRLERTDVTSPFGGKSSVFRETACSDWYAANVEPNHEHVWSGHSAMVILNAYDQAVGAADNVERPGRAVWRLTPEEQVEIYRHFPDPLKAKDVFVSLTSPQVMQDRRDLSIADSLGEWIDSDFPGEWEPPAE